MCNGVSPGLAFELSEVVMREWSTGYTRPNDDDERHVTRSSVVPARVLPGLIAAMWYHCGTSLGL